MTSTRPLQELHDRLGVEPDDLLSLGHVAPGGDFVGGKTNAKAAQVRDWTQDRNWYLGCNVLKPDTTNARGTEQDLLRVTALVSDLDRKPNGMPTWESIDEVISVLSDMIGTGPAAVITTGNGKQPYWAVEEDDRWPSVLTRWNLLVRVVAERHGGNVDTTKDKARVWRVPGTMHLKGEPKPVTADFPPSWHPVTFDAVTDALDAYGIPEVEELHGDAVSAPAEWGYAEQPCPYVTRMVAGWATDVPANGRHPWLLSQAVRLAAAHRMRCLTETQHTDAVAALEARFASLLGGDRPLRAAEIRSAHLYAIDKVSRKSDEQCWAELGGNPHNHRANSGGDSDGDGDAGFTFDERVQLALDRLRIAETARSILSAEKADAAFDAIGLPPAVTGSDYIDTHADTETEYLIDQLAEVGDRVLLAAQAKAGKTTLIGNILTSLTTGAKFLGHFDTRPVGSDSVVALINTELGDRKQARWLAHAVPPEARDKVLVWTVTGRTGGLDTRTPTVRERIRDHLVNAAQGRRIAVLIVDVASAWTAPLGIDENSNAEVRAWLESLHALAHDIGADGLILAHHAGHGQERSRGASAWQDWPDALWNLNRGGGGGSDDDPSDSDARYLRVVAREGDGLPESQLTFDPRTRTLSVNGTVGVNRQDAVRRRRAEDRLQEVVEAVLAEPGLSQRRLRQKVRDEHGGHIAAIVDAIKLALERGLIVDRGVGTRSILHPTISRDSDEAADPPPTRPQSTQPPFPTDGKR